MERDKLAKFSPGIHYYYYYYSNLNACIYRIGEVNELKKFNFSTSFNFESLKVNISFTDRNF